MGYGMPAMAKCCDGGLDWEQWLQYVMVVCDSLLGGLNGFGHWFYGG